jgi:hypothetical protein
MADMSDDIADLPVFALNAVLFPGGVLALKIFEQRYMEMATASLRHGTPFGICLIERGSEVGAPAQPHALGCLAAIEGWEMLTLGVLHVSVRGGQRFRILDQAPDARGLVRARARPLPAEAPVEVPPHLQDLIPLLSAVVEDAGEQRIPPPHRYEDASWVGYRFAEILPISLTARQKLLELEDALSRLQIIHRYLAERSLLG